MTDDDLERRLGLTLAARAREATAPRGLAVGARRRSRRRRARQVGVLAAVAAVVIVLAVGVQSRRSTAPGNVVDSSQSSPSCLLHRDAPLPSRSQLADLPLRDLSLCRYRNLSRGQPADLDVALDLSSDQRDRVLNELTTATTPPADCSGLDDAGVYVLVLDGADGVQHAITVPNGNCSFALADATYVSGPVLRLLGDLVSGATSRTPTPDPPRPDPGPCAGTTVSIQSAGRVWALYPPTDPEPVTLTTGAPATLVSLGPCAHGVQVFPADPTVVGSTEHTTSRRGAVRGLAAGPLLVAAGSSHVYVTYSACLPIDQPACRGPLSERAQAVTVAADTAPSQRLDLLVSNVQTGSPDPADVSGVLALASTGCVTVGGVPVVWPRGWSAYETTDGVVVDDADGNVAAATGDVISLGGGFGRTSSIAYVGDCAPQGDEAFFVSSGVTLQRTTDDACLGLEASIVQGDRRTILLDHNHYSPDTRPIELDSRHPATLEFSGGCSDQVFVAPGSDERIAAASSPGRRRGHFLAPGSLHLTRGRTTLEVRGPGTCAHILDSHGQACAGGPGPDLTYDVTIR